MGNANSGARPLPHAVKVLRGVTRKDRVTPREVKPPAGQVAKPTTLSPGASTVWDETAWIGEHMGTVTRADVKAFATFCELQATFTANALQKGKRGGKWKLATELKVANALRPFYERFGLDPVGRARVSLPKADEAPVSKWAGALP